MTRDPHVGPPFRVATVPGVKPDKWSRIWRERQPGIRLQLVAVSEQDQFSILQERLVDMAFVRFPAGAPPDDPAYHLIPLYRESTDATPACEHTQIGLAWLAVDPDAHEDIDTFIGIVRGRTARSSRGTPRS